MTSRTSVLWWSSHNSCLGDPFTLSQPRVRPPQLYPVKPGKPVVESQTHPSGVFINGRQLLQHPDWPSILSSCRKIDNGRLSIQLRIDVFDWAAVFEQNPYSVMPSHLHRIVQGRRPIREPPPSFVYVCAILRNQHLPMSRLPGSSADRSGMERLPCWK